MVSNVDTIASGQDQASSVQFFDRLTIPEFKPHAFMRCRHRQTVLGLYLPGYKFDYRADRHLVETSHDDLLALHDDCPPQWQEGDRVAILLPGLAGCHGSPYLVRTAGKLYARGVRVFRLDLRGTGDSARTTQHIGHAGRSEDVVASVQLVHEMCGESPIALVGYSMGGNIVLKAVGESSLPDHHHRLPGVDRAVAIAPPISLPECCAVLQQGVSRLYNRNFARMLCQIAERRRQMHPTARHSDLSPKPKDLRQFDELLTAPLSGFRDAEDYYHRASAARVLKHIELPTLIISSQDDPLIPYQIFAEAQFSPTTRLHTTRFGGHLGFVGRRGVDPDRRWVDWRIVDAVTLG